MKRIQVLLVFIGIFVFIAIGLLTATVSPAKLLAQPPVTPNIGEPPSRGNDLAIFTPQTPATSTAPMITNADHLVYLPVIYTPACTLNDQEKALASLIVNDTNQKRPSMNCNPTLANVARSRALDMGQRNYFSHVNPDGLGPNILVVQAGYSLPSGWTSPATLNYIESIAGGYPTAAMAFNAWIQSSGHRPHVLGEDAFWAAQTNYGVGYAYVENSPYKHYWVFISAPPQS